MKIFHFFAVMLVLFNISFSAAEEQASSRSWVDKNRILSSLEYPQQVRRIYQDNNNQLIWFDTPTMNTFEQELDVIRRAGFSPLFTQRLSVLKKYREDKKWFEYDLFATDTLIMYLSYAEQVEKVGRPWFFEGKKMIKALPAPSDNAFASVNFAVGSNSMDALLQLYSSSDYSYRPLMDAYRSLLPFESEQIPFYYQRGIKKSGDLLENRDVLIKRLSLVNLDMSSIRDNVTIYDENLVKVVQQFQAMHGLIADGVIGPDTMKWVNLAVRIRLSILALNIERSRLWGQEQSTAIIVNIPGFDMKYWLSGKPVFSSKVVVGRSSRPTPLLSTKLDSVIVNPTWTVPRKIIVEDILPMARRDVSYFSRHNIDIIKGWKKERVIDPTKIDWTTIEAEKFPYRLRQKSGKQNALGLYKFNTPNSRAIYLHDTPSKHLFNHASRAYSSGCIRVENASLFASKILQTQGMDRSNLRNSRQPTNKLIALKSKIPVHIIYQTVWFEDGSLQYRDDIYRFDLKSRTNG